MLVSTAFIYKNNACIFTLLFHQVISSNLNKDVKALSINRLTLKGNSVIDFALVNTTRFNLLWLFPDDFPYH